MKHTLKERFKYWFDSLLTDNRAGLVMILLLATIIFVLILSIPVFIIKEDIVANLWDNFATAINAWWPFTFDNYDLSDGSAVNDHIIILMRLFIAIFGLFLTSALIGYISERISEKFARIQRGNSKVIEEGHIIVVGFDEKNFTLIRELILANNKRKILIVDDKDLGEMREHINVNIDVSTKTKIIYRSINPFDVDDFKKCSVEDSFAVVIQPMDDVKTLKAIMSTKKILHSYPKSKTHIVSAINNEENMIKFSTKNDVMFYTKSLIARVIASSNSQQGLSKVLFQYLVLKILNFI